MAAASPARYDPVAADRPRRVPSRATLGLILVVAALAVGVGTAAARQALWQVVRACVADSQMTGAPFPCLAVDLSGGVDAGVAVLRPPVGRPDTILAPTRKVVGVEDPWLQSPAAPNYFAAALRARTFVKTRDGSIPELGDVALAVNSRFARTQDQLHIHIGCASPRIGRALRIAVASSGVGEWTPLRSRRPGVTMWAMRTGKSDLDQIDPFRLAAQRFGAEGGDLGRLTVAVIGARIAGRDELALLVADEGDAQFSAEEIVDPTCAAAGL